MAVSVVAGLEPAGFWNHFERLARIPRPTGREEQASAHVERWAAGRGFALDRDAAGNLVVRVPATAGRESARVVICQGHLDMVCERRPDGRRDPAEEGVVLVRDGGWVKADGTTLGADDGVAIAAMLALADEESLPHGPLELLMTVAEEVGLEGANGLDPSLLSGRILLNLDSEEDGQLTVGCAGATGARLRIARPREACPAAAAATLEVAVGGGLGGHSGIDIARGRANAVKLLGLVLREAARAARFRLVSFDGGRSRNAIPRDAAAHVVVPAASERAFRAAVGAAAASAREAYAAADPGVTVTVVSVPSAADAWNEEATATLLDAVALVPAGPLALVPGLEGLVETSSSLGEARTEGEELVLRSLLRSANDAALPGVVAAFEAVAHLTGGALEVQRNYGGWRPNLDSEVLAVARRVHERLFGREARVESVHAGLEPAVIGEKLPGLDMISLGPRIEAAHSPDERLDIESVARFWRLLAGILDELSAA